MEALIGLLGTVIGAIIAGFVIFSKEKQQKDFENAV
jgi:biopolymer transport protein ExbB/TolQ